MLPRKLMCYYYIDNSLIESKIHHDTSLIEKLFFRHHNYNIEIHPDLSRSMNHIVHPHVVFHNVNSLKK